MKRARPAGWIKEAAALALLLSGCVFAVHQLAARPLPARSLIDGEALDQGEALLTGYAPPRVDPSDRMPLGQLLVDAAVLHQRPSRERLLLLAAAAAAAALLFGLAEQLGPLACAPLAVALWCAFCVRLLPPNIGLMRQLTYAVFVLLSAGLLAWRARAPSASPWMSLALGCAAGCSLLVRSPLAFFAPLLALYEWAVLRHFSTRSYRKHLAPLCLVPFLFLLPWVAMNAVVQRRFVPFEGAAALKAVIPAALGAVTTSYARTAQPLMESGGAPAAGGPLAWAAREALLHPLRYARGYFARLAYYILLVPWLFAAAAAAVWLLREREPVRQTGLFCLYFLLINCLVGVSDTHLYPLLPVLCALAAALPFYRLKKAPAAMTLAAKAGLGGGLAGALILALSTDAVVARYAAAAARRPPQSSGALREALSRHRDEAWLLYQSGGRSLAQGGAAAAAPDLARAAALRPDIPAFRLRSAWALALQGDAGPLFETDWRGALPGPNEPSSLLDERPADAAALYKTLIDLRRGERASADLELATALARWEDTQAKMIPTSDLDTGLTQRLEKASDAQFPGQIDLLLPDVPAASRLTVLQELARLRPKNESIAAAVSAFRADVENASHARPEDPAGVLIEQAQDSRRAGQRWQALFQLDRAMGLASSDEVRHRIALLYQDLGSLDKALNALTRLTRRHPQDAGLLKDLGICQFQAGLAREAQESLRAAHAADPGLMGISETLAAIRASRKAQAPAR